MEEKEAGEAAAGQPPLSELHWPALFQSRQVKIKEVSPLRGNRV
jgi:hypothetical protein